MVALSWYLYLFHGDEKIDELGPFTFKEANQKAKTLGLPDGDR